MKNKTNIEEILNTAKKAKIKIRTPQFERIDNSKVLVPKNKKEFKNIINKKNNKKELIKMGCMLWNENKEQSHLLFPFEWYNVIPNGFEVITISGRKEKFKNGVTDDDKRFGMLPYGIILKN